MGERRTKSDRELGELSFSLTRDSLDPFPNEENRRVQREKRKVRHVNKQGSIDRRIR